MLSINERKMKDRFAIFFLVFVIIPLANFAQSSPNYTIQNSVVDQGGSTSTSADFKLGDAIGQPGPAWTASSAGFNETSGFMAGPAASLIIMDGVADKTPADIPGTFSLDQNYPNPFNPTTNIVFHLPSKSFVSLKIFDLHGKEAATLVSEELAAGNHSRQWNAARLPGGVYFYRLQAETVQETKKLILLK